MNFQITTAERARLVELESVIESNVAIVGNALFEIRESRLYRQDHKTFEDYCQARFAMDRRYINMQINASKVIYNLGTNCSQTLPMNEAQARPLSKLPPSDQPKAWKKANEIAKEEGRPVAARHVERAVEEVIDAVVVDGTKSKGFTFDPRIADPSGPIRPPAESNEFDSLHLRAMKKLWKKANKKEKQAFLQWQQQA